MCLDGGWGFCTDGSASCHLQTFTRGGTKPLFHPHDQGHRAPVWAVHQSGIGAGQSSGVGAFNAVDQESRSQTRGRLKPFQTYLARLPLRAVLRAHPDMRHAKGSGESLLIRPGLCQRGAEFPFTEVTGVSDDLEGAGQCRRGEQSQRDQQNGRPREAAQDWLRRVRAS
jgi:hypothetical protein